MNKIVRISIVIVMVSVIFSTLASADLPIIIRLRNAQNVNYDFEVTYNTLTDTKELVSDDFTAVEIEDDARFVEFPRSKNGRRS